MRAVTKSDRAALQVTMIVFVDMQVGPVYLRLSGASYRRRMLSTPQVLLIGVPAINSFSTVKEGP